MGRGADDPEMTMRQQLKAACAAVPALLLAGGALVAQEPAKPKTGGTPAVPVQRAQPAPRQYDQEAMKANFEAMKTHDWYVGGGWTTDFDAAKAKAKESGKPIFAYFTRTYAP